MRTVSSAFLIAILALWSIATAGDFSGKVTDNAGKPVANVNLSVDGANLGEVTDSSGVFSFSIPDRNVCYATFSHISYKPNMVQLQSNGPRHIELDFAVHPVQGITVTADRAIAGETPIAFTDFTSQDIERDYALGEFPLLLEGTPNVYAYADAGGGLGYSYLRIRGFSDKQISTYINGVPLNDPEDQATYFVDLPDFAANVKDIQIQRGVGNSMYGDASFGGSVNIVSAGLEQPRLVKLTTGYGGFWQDGEWIGDMEKQSIEYQSGLIAGRWNLSARYSRQLSDGYRGNSWYDGWSYYISAMRLDPRMTTTVNIYGGPMKMHLAYWGISQEQLERDRRYNPLTYDNETDNFNQPHYEVHNTIRLSDNMTLQNTAYHIHGEGYYEQYKDERDFAEYNIDPVVILSAGNDTLQQFDSGDLVRQQWVNKNQWGLNPRLDISHARGQTSLGGSFYYFESDHWGQVVWGEHITNAIAPRHRYYQYFGEKFYLSLYAVENYRLSKRLRLMANLQFRHQTYNFDQVELGAFRGYDYNLNWNFFSPRVGVTYAMNDALSLLFNYSLSFRTPADYEIYDANDPSAVPSLDVDLERVHDFELGADFTLDRVRTGINLYWMEFDNEIVPFGGVNEDGLPITANAKRSVHAGVEFSGGLALGRAMTLSGNFSYSYNRYKDFTVREETYTNDQDWEWVGYRDYGYDDKVIPGFPEYIGNLLFEYDRAPFGLACRVRAVGQQYVENRNVEALSIDPFFLSSISARVALGNLLHVGKLVFAVKIDNLFDEQYLASGYGGSLRFRDSGDSSWAEYIPAAGRSIFSSLALELN